MVTRGVKGLVILLSGLQIKVHIHGALLVLSQGVWASVRLVGRGD